MKLTSTLFVLIMIGSVSLLKSQTLIASYNFNGGLAADASGNGHTGTFYGSSATVDTLNIGYNTTDYFSVPGAVLNSKVAFSIMLKLKFAGLNTTGLYATNTIFSADNSSTTGIFAFSYQKDINMWRVGNGATAFDFADNSITTGKWYCVTLTRDNSGNMKLYVDGVQNSTVNVYATPLDITSFLIGQETDCFAGCFVANQSGYAKFDDVRFYNNALTSTQISSNCFALVSVNEYDQLQISVSPNPVNGSFLKISNKDNISDFNLVVSSIDGKILKEAFYKNEAEIALDINELKPGIYFLTMSHHGKTSTVKFIKE